MGELLGGLAPFAAIAQMNESGDKLSTRITEVDDSIATRMNRKVGHR